MKKLFFQISKKAIGHELISGSAYYFLGSMIANFLGFLFNLFVIRKLTTLDYGIYASLLSLFSLTVLIPQSFSTTIVQFATQYLSKGDTDRAKLLYFRATLVLSGLGMLILFAICVTAPVIGSYLHVNNIWFIVGTGVLIALSYISMVNNAYLLSLLKFGFVSFTLAFAAAIKLLSGIILVFLGFGIFGALGAIGLSFVAPYVLSFLPLKFLFKKVKKKAVVPLNDMIKYALPSMVTVIALSSFISSDVILAKHFLSGTQAGLYAGISLAGRVIFYFTGMIPAVMFPILIHKRTQGHGVQNTFYLGLLLVGIPSLFMTVFYFLYPSFVLIFFLGGKQYLSQVNNIGFMALFLALYSIMSVMVNFFLSMKQTKIAYPVAVMALLQILGISIFHQTILQIVIVSLWTSCILVALLLIYYLYHHKMAKTYIVSVPIYQKEI